MASSLGLTAPTQNAFDPSDIEKLLAPRLSSDPYSAIGLTGAILGRENQTQNYLKALQETNALANIMKARSEKAGLMEKFVQYGPDWADKVGALAPPMAESLGMPTVSPTHFQALDLTRLNQRVADVTKIQSESVKNVGEAKVNGIAPVAETGTVEQLLSRLKQITPASTTNALIKGAHDVKAAEVGKVENSDASTVQFQTVQAGTPQAEAVAKMLEELGNTGEAAQIRSLPPGMSYTPKVVLNNKSSVTKKGPPGSQSGPADTGGKPNPKPAPSMSPAWEARIKQMGGDPSRYEIRKDADGVERAYKRS